MAAPLNFDFVVIGSGVAGLHFALRVAEHGSVAIVTKKRAAESATNYAQGGIAAVMHTEDSFDANVKDTRYAGAGLCDEGVVKFVVERGPIAIQNLLKWGVNFDRAEKAGADGPEYFYARLLSESWKHDLSERSARQLAYWAGRLDRCQFTGPDAHADLARALVRPGEISAARLATASSHLKTAIYQGADVRDLARDPQLRDLFKHDPLLFQTETAIHQGSCPEPIPNLYNTIHIGAEEFQVSQET